MKYLSRFISLTAPILALFGLNGCSINEVRSPASSAALTRSEVYEIHNECNGMIGCMIDRLNMYQNDHGELAGPHDPQKVQLYRSSDCLDDINGKSGLAITLRFPNEIEPALDTAQDDRCLDVNESLKEKANEFKQSNGSGGFTVIKNYIRAYKINGGGCMKLKSHTLEEYCRLDTFNELTQEFARND